MTGKKMLIGAILLISAVVLMAGCTGSSSKVVKTGDNVTVDYALWVGDNTSIIETSNATLAQQAGIYSDEKALEGAYGPLSYVIGDNTVIPGFENGTIGMKVGETKTINIAPADAYGEYDPELVMGINMSDLTDAGITPHVNDTLYYNFNPVTVVGIPNNTTVMIDFNHPMAGKTLHFSITLLAINGTK